ncbi:MAG TPA: hypothetical protein VGN32_04535, partial [Ktedonobacterales bacterium]|nr:hypothetical protein [Ktedonobacterales bacterium]
MSQQPPYESGDDFRAEVSDLHPRTNSGAAAPSRSLLATQRTVRQHTRRVALTLAAGVLALAIVLASLPGVRQQAAALFTHLGPAPTPTLATGADFFYLLPNPPGVAVSLDGRALSRLPYPGDPHPLQLSRGRHTLVWRSRPLPFAALQCVVSVPPAHGDTCAVVTSQILAADGLVLAGTVIATHVSLAALAAKGADLTRAIQRALDATRSSALVQPGEHYYFYAPGQFAGPVLATQPLRATLTYQLVTVGGYPEPCDLDRGQTIPCRFPGQNCGQLCTVLASSVPGTDATHDWIAAALVRATWQYATLDGHVLAHDIAESFG